MSTKLNMLGSQRKFDVAILSPQNSELLKRIPISEILTEDYEFCYALCDVIDDVLDLQVGGSMYFNPNRDNKAYRGIILRTE